MRTTDVGDEMFGPVSRARRVKKVDRAFCSLKMWFYREFTPGTSAEMRGNFVAKQPNQAVVGD